MAEEEDAAEEATGGGRGWKAAKSKLRILQPPESQDKWKLVTDAVLNDARSLTSEMWKQLEEQESVEGSHPAPLSPTTGRSMKQGGGKPRFLDSNSNLAPVGPRAVISLHGSLDKCRRCKEDISRVMEEVKSCHIRAQHAQRAKWSGIKVCDWRLELRAKRPPSEQFSDHLQQALEKESQTLHAARLQMAEQAALTAKMQENMESVVHSVNRRLSESLLPSKALCKHKHWGLFNETSGSSPSAATAATAVEAALAEGATAAPEELADVGEGAVAAAAPGSSATSKADIRLETEEEVLARAAQLQREAAKLTKQVDKAISKSEQECEAAMRAVAQSLAKRTVETREIRSKLEGQLDEISRAITAAETSLFKAKTRFHTSTDGTVSGKTASTEVLLEKLKEAKSSLEEELRCKIAAHKIDEQCSRLPRHMTPSHKKAVTVDYGKLVVSLSEPSLLSVDPATGRSLRSTPNSPSGPSSPGKLLRGGVSLPSSPQAPGTASTPSLNVSKSLKAAAASLTGSK